MAELEAAFKLLDKNGDGQICSNELKAFLAKMDADADGRRELAAIVKRYKQME